MEFTINKDSTNHDIEGRLLIKQRNSLIYNLTTNLYEDGLTEGEMVFSDDEVQEAKDAIGHAIKKVKYKIVFECSGE